MFNLKAVNFQGYDPAERIPKLFETPQLSVIDQLWIRFGISAYEVADHILVVDISHWNGDVVWSLLRSSGVVAVILKCSEGAENTYYEYKDVKFELFWQSALDWGFPIMVYHFFRGEKGAAEFSWFMKCAHNFLNDVQIMGNTAAWLDCEWKPGGMNTTTYANRAFGFTSLTKEEGLKNGIYSSPGLVPSLFPYPDTDPRWNKVNQWNAHWTPGEDTLPPGWSEELRIIHQRGIYNTHWWTEKVEGAGKVDINHMFMASEHELREWLGQGAIASPSASPSPSPSSSVSASASASPSPSAPECPECCQELWAEVDKIKAGMALMKDDQAAMQKQLDHLNGLLEVLRGYLCV